MAAMLEPNDIPAYFAEAWNERDAAKLAAIFVEDAEFVNVTGLWWHDRTSIEKAHAYGLRTIFRESTLTIRKTRIRKLAPGLVLIHARMHLSGQTAIDGIDKPGPRQTIMSFVAERTGDSWMVISAHNTDIVPGKETHVVSEEGELTAVDYRKS